MIRYKLDDLGPYQFEWLIQSLLKMAIGLLVESWGGSGDHGRDAFFDGALTFERERPSPGPFLFQAKFVASANAAGARSASVLKSAVAKELARVDHRRKRGAWAPVKHYVLVTNAPIASGLRATLREQMRSRLDRARIHLFGGSDVCDLLDQNPQLRRAFPQLLSLRDLKDLLAESVNKDCLQRSKRALELAVPLAHVFVPTAPYERTIETLLKHNFAVLEGPPEMGKSAIAWMMGLAQLSQGWDVISADTPEDVFRGFDGERSQLFVSDDAFGRTEYDPSRGSRWEPVLERILNLLGSQHWLIWTTRKHILERAVRVLDLQGRASHFPDPAAVLVDASKLTIREKALILYRHARRLPMGKNSRPIVKAHAPAIVNHHAFTPERIRYFVEERLPELATEYAGREVADDHLAKEIHETIRNPTRRMRLAFQRLAPAYKWFLISMLEGGYWPTPMDARKHYERHCSEDDRLPFEQVTDEMTESFVRNVMPDGSRISWVHPSYRDLVIEELSQDVVLRTRFLQTASVDGAKLAISDTGGAAGERLFPLLRTDRDWELFCERAVDICQTGEPATACDLLEALAAAIPQAPDNTVSERLKGLLTRACDAARQKWDRAGDVFGPEQLMAYAACSLIVDPIPPVPKLDRSWDVQASSLETDEFRLEMLEDWAKFVSAVYETEPRFLRKVGFPSAYEDKLESVITAVQRDLLDTEVDDDDLRRHSDSCVTAANVFVTLAPSMGDRRDEWMDLGARLKARATRLREKADQTEEAEPDYEPDAAPQAFDIAALFADL